MGTHTEMPHYALVKPINSKERTNRWSNCFYIKVPTNCRFTSLLGGKAVLNECS